MKKRFIILITILAVVFTSVCSAFAGSTLEITKITPKNGSKTSQPLNMAVKITFSDTMVGAANIDANATKIKITDPEGKAQAFKMVYSEKYPDELLLLLENALEAKTEYKITIDKGITSANGLATSEETVSVFSTRNTGTDSIISTVTMVLMIGVMIFMTSRSAKKAQQEAEILTVAQAEKLNPYKIAKAKKISLEEAEKFVAKAKEKARKAEAAALEAKRRREAISEAERKAIEAEVDSEERRNGWFRVHTKGSLVAHGIACPKSIKKKNAAKRKAAEERAKKYAKNKKKK